MLGQFHCSPDLQTALGGEGRGQKLSSGPASRHGRPCRPQAGAPLLPGSTSVSFSNMISKGPPPEDGISRSDAKASWGGSLALQYACPEALPSGGGSWWEWYHSMTSAVSTPVKRAQTRGWRSTCPAAAKAEATRSCALYLISLVFLKTGFPFLFLSNIKGLNITPVVLMVHLEKGTTIDIHQVFCISQTNGRVSRWEVQRGCRWRYQK